MMDPILDKFRGLIATLDLHPPQLRFVSNLTGTWITPEQAMSPQYWTDHLRNTVRFASGIDELMKDPSVLFIETGPGRALSVFVKNHPGANQGRTILTTIRHPQDHQDDDIFLFASIAKLWLAGVRMEWQRFYAEEERKRISLPTYPFERKRYWIEPDTTLLGNIGERKIVKRKNIQDWFYIPSWKKLPLLKAEIPNQGKLNSSRWLILIPSEQENSPFTEALYMKVNQDVSNIVFVRPGKEYREIDLNTFEVNPGIESDYTRLITDLAERNWRPDRILHGFSIGESSDPSTDGQMDQFFDRGFYSLLFLTQALLSQWSNLSLNITVLSSGSFQVFGNETIIPENATLNGLCLVIPQENPNVHCKLVDIELHLSGQHDLDKQANFVIRECAVTTSEKFIAIRNNSRWVQTYEQVVDWTFTEKNPRLRQEGVYLITGGLGRIGLIYANYLSRTRKAKIILVDRLAFPAREMWDEWLGKHNLSDSISLRILALQEIEAQGGIVDLFCGNVSELADVGKVLDYTVEKYGVLHGIIHSAGFVSSRFDYSSARVEKA